MKTLFATFALLAGLSTVALAGDPEPAADDAANACGAEQTQAAGDEAKCNCSEGCKEKAEGAECDCGHCHKKAEAEAEPEEKGGKAMKKSNDGNMTSYDEDE
ncbi:MAG: hypothetical protein H6742_04660 [Alphaproteobacteria bacterium]|nr:hypothetical protein [Alphaproteobacteria bacterium]